MTCDMTDLFNLVNLDNLPVPGLRVQAMVAGTVVPPLEGLPLDIPAEALQDAMHQADAVQAA